MSSVIEDIERVISTNQDRLKLAEKNIENFALQLFNAIKKQKNSFLEHIRNISR